MQVNDQPFAFQMEDLDDDDSEYDEEEHEMEKAALLSKSHAVTPLVRFLIPIACTLPSFVSLTRFCAPTIVSLAFSLPALPLFDTPKP